MLKRRGDAYRGKVITMRLETVAASGVGMNAAIVLTSPRSPEPVRLAQRM
jgi:hypothetical protein